MGTQMFSLTVKMKAVYRYANTKLMSMYTFRTTGLFQDICPNVYSIAPDGLQDGSVCGMGDPNLGGPGIDINGKTSNTCSFITYIV